jgi:hypothetical protein
VDLKSKAVPCAHYRLWRSIRKNPLISHDLKSRASIPPEGEAKNSALPLGIMAEWQGEITTTKMTTKLLLQKKKKIFTKILLYA